MVQVAVPGAAVGQSCRAGVGRPGFQGQPEVHNGVRNERRMGAFCGWLYSSDWTMSSPLTLLGKNRRVPLSDVRNVWSREVLHKDDNTQREAVVPDGTSTTEVHQSICTVTGESTSQLKAKQKKSANNGSGLSDLALMSTMMQKLGQLEHKVHRQAMEIQQKDKKILILEEKLKLLNWTREKPTEQNRIQDLEAACLSLQEQVWEMERFLNDYGMIWVGSRKGSDLENQEEEHGDYQERACDMTFWRPGAAVTRDFCVNFDVVLQSIQDLNTLAGEGQCHVEVTRVGARLTHQALVPSVPLTLYRNGILMFEGPFRSFQEPSTQQCIMDLMDGYFPSELRERFPDGVTFQVTDRREEEFKEKPKWTGFPGKGCSVGGVMENTDSGIANLDTPCPVPGGSRRTEWFLQRLPRRVVRAGKVIDVREAVKSSLQVSSDSSSSPAVTLINTSTLQDSKFSLAQPQRRVLSGDVTSLRVRSEDGEHTFVLKMLSSDTIGQLRYYLDRHRSLQNTSYDILSTFPPHRYDNDDQTLLSCGLMPSAVLLLRARKTHENP